MPQKSNKEILDDWITAHGMRRTAERTAVLEAAERAGRLFTPQKVLQLLREGSPAFNVSLTTVYSTLNLLVEAGLARTHAFGAVRGRVFELAAGAGSRAVRAADGDPYLVCRRCGHVRRWRDADRRALAEPLRAVKVAGFKPESYELVIHGLCTPCQRKTRHSDKSQPKRNPTKPSPTTTSKQ